MATRRCGRSRNVRPTLEVVLQEASAHLRKKKDPETGLALIALEGS